MLSMNEPTVETAGQFTMVSGTAKFNSSGGILMGVIGNQAIWETPHYIKGYTAFENIAPTMSGGTIGNYLLEYALDTGSGYGVWKTLSAVNLITEVISPTGFKFKIRITTNITNTTAITFVRVYMQSSWTAMSENTYPLDTATVVMVGLVDGSIVKATKTSDGTVLFTGTASGGQISFQTEYIGGIRLEARKASTAPHYIPYVTQVTSISGVTTTATALQQLDE